MSLTTVDLAAWAARTPAPRGPADQACASCARLHCPGWESLPAGFPAGALRVVGTLRSAEPEATWAEYHPQGTRLDSPTAPIALGWYPYNRADLCACQRCGRLFLRYLEAGGYYVDERVREFDVAWLVEPGLPP